MSDYDEIKAGFARIEVALNSALNMIEGDGGPPDWDYLRLVRSQLPVIMQAVWNHADTAASVAYESGERQCLIKAGQMKAILGTAVSLAIGLAIMPPLLWALGQFYLHSGWVQYWLGPQ